MNMETHTQHDVDSPDYEITDATRYVIAKRVSRRNKLTVSVSAVDAATTDNLFAKCCAACSPVDNERRMKKGGAMYVVELKFQQASNQTTVFHFCGEHVGQMMQGISMGVHAASCMYYERQLAAALKKAKVGS